MTDSSYKNQCLDPTQTMTIEIPCGLVARTEKFAVENETTLSGVIIEALDTFLRSRPTNK